MGVNNTFLVQYCYTDSFGFLVHFTNIFKIVHNDRSNNTVDLLIEYYYTSSTVDCNLHTDS